MIFCVLLALVTRLSTVLGEWDPSKGTVEFQWLFDDHFDENSEEEINKNVASSTEDLAKLYKYEHDLFKKIQSYVSLMKHVEGVNEPNRKKLIRISENMIQNIETLSENDYIEHVKSPIICFHLLKRYILYWPKKSKTLLTLLKSSQVKTADDKVKRSYEALASSLRSFPFVETSELSVAAAGAILNIQRFYNITPAEIRAGRLGRTSQNQTLDVDDILLIAGKKYFLTDFFRDAVSL